MRLNPTGRMSLAESVHDGVLTLAVAGELDVAAERRVRAWLEEHASAHGDAVTLDLRAVTFADSAGLRALINADAAARRDGWTLRIVVVDGPVRETLAVSGLESMLPVYAEPGAGPA
jgi:anti-sigma B factor antagonist